jgi:hypothetical protein
MPPKSASLPAVWDGRSTLAGDTSDAHSGMIFGPPAQLSAHAPDPWYLRVRHDQADPDQDCGNAH